MIIKGYSDDYKEGVLACLKRNYGWMRAKSDKELLHWLQPIISYSWAEDFANEDCPYKYGMVLINDDTVVGYLGLIYSRQFIDDTWKTVVNPTTWAIDKEYRSETFKCIYMVQQTADIVIDYTARQSLVEIFTKMFNYKNIDKFGCFFLPKLFYFGKRHIKIKKLISSIQIENEHIKKIYDDHIAYNIKCMEVSDGNQKEYVFYKIHEKATVLKKLVPLDGIYVLYTSDSSFFGKYAKEIIYKMQKIEHAALKTDSRFFEIDENKFKKLRTFPINRLVYCSYELIEQPASIYSELGILLEE